MDNIRCTRTERRETCPCTCHAAGVTGHYPESCSTHYRRVNERLDDAVTRYRRHGPVDETTHVTAVYGW